MIDPHFNIFYSYDRGSKKDKESLSQLEDNITRGFLIVLKNLEPIHQRKFLKDLVGTPKNKSTFQSLSFDLQNIEKKEELIRIQAHRYLVWVEVADR